MKEIAGEIFERVFGDKSGAQSFFAPGRVNLIGEHTDYNGGHVFPCALSLGTYCTGRQRGDKRVRLYSENFRESGVIEFDIEDLKYTKEHSWANYPKGVIEHLRLGGCEIKAGFEAVFIGNLPNGAGLSSSASIELVTAVMLKEFFNLNMEPLDMVIACRDAENKFIGMNCGIMDQFIIGMGKENTAVLLDTNTLKYEYVDLRLDGISIVIANTNKQRRLEDSKYNERRSQCEEALRDLNVELNITSLGELSEEEFEKYRHLIRDDVNRKRARHAVYENRRTLRAVEALKNNDIEGFGRLMNESHYSLRDDYEVSCRELDILVDLAQRHRGVLGSRMTGAGFGGCTVSLVEDEYIEDFMKNLGEGYLKEIGYTASFYIAQTGRGAGEI